MMKRVTDKNFFSFEDFKKWLDLNPGVRKIVYSAVRPNLFTLLNDDKPYLLCNKGEARHGSFHDRAFRMEEDEK